MVSSTEANCTKAEKEKQLKDEMRTLLDSYFGVKLNISVLWDRNELYANLLNIYGILEKENVAQACSRFVSVLCFANRSHGQSLTI